MSKAKDVCCGPAAHEHIRYRPVPVAATIATASGDIAAVSARWRIGDYLGMAAARLGIARMDYALAPGLYAVGAPAADSPVLVSANYKLSFDVLRRGLAGQDIWILVIDTKGVNVWCAAGKGSFGTDEIVRGIAATGLSRVVAHRTIIVPQLGAPGVAAHTVKASSGFTVVYGPVRARDITAFLRAGMRADPAMRRVSFTMRERLAVSWLEFVTAFKTGLAAAAVYFIAMGITKTGFSPADALHRAGPVIGLLLAGILSGTILTALFLPLIPGRAFSVKGGLLGAVIAAGIIAMRAVAGQGMPVIDGAAALLFVSGISGYLALNFTGCSTYTSPSGVNAEVHTALPVIKTLMALAVCLHIVSRVAGS